MFFSNRNYLGQMEVIINIYLYTRGMWSKQHDIHPSKNIIYHNYIVHIVIYIYILYKCYTNIVNTYTDLIKNTDIITLLNLKFICQGHQSTGNVEVVLIGR